MKTSNNGISTIAIIFALSWAVATMADQPGMTQRAAANHLEIQRVHGPRITELPPPQSLRATIVVGGKAGALAQDFRKVPSTGPGLDLAHAPRPLTSSKDPDFDKKLRENAQKQFEIAPLK